MNNIIQVHDKTFKLYMSDVEIQKEVKRVAAELSRDFKGKDVILCPVLTGSYLFAADLTRYMDFDPELAFVRYSSYAGMQSTGHAKAVLGFPERCRGRHVVIVEDVVDTGETVSQMLEDIKPLEPASVSVCAFFFKPGSFRKSYKVDYIGRSIPDDFIVGYGLDYDGEGRTYKDVYSIAE